jgi:RNA polymerase sigma factor, sigma-70 family
MPEEYRSSLGQGSEMRDQQLLAWMKEDFDAGFGKLVENYWRELYHCAYRILEGSVLTYLAEDAVQEGLISAYKDLRHNHQKLDNLHLQKWLYVIVRQKSINCLKQANKQVYLADLSDRENAQENRVASKLAVDLDCDPAYRIERYETVKEAHRTVNELLKNLSATQREAVALKYLYRDGTDPKEITYQQMSKRLQKPVGTLKSDVSRAMQHMRRQLSENEEQMLFLPMYNHR